MIKKTHVWFIEKKTMNVIEEEFVSDIVNLDIGSLRKTLATGQRPWQDAVLEKGRRYRRYQLGYWLMRTLYIHVARMQDGSWIQEGQHNAYVEAASEHPHLMINLRKQVLKICRLLFAHGYRSDYGAYFYLMKMEEYEVAHAVIEALGDTLNMHSSLCAELLFPADEALQKHPTKADTLKLLMKAILKRCNAATSVEDIHGAFSHTAFRWSDVCKELVKKELTYRAREPFLAFSHHVQNDPDAVSIYPQISRFLAIPENKKDVAVHLTPFTEHTSRKRKRSETPNKHQRGGATKRRKQKQKHRKISRKRR